MKKFIIEREIPGLGNLSAEELQAITRKSNETLKEMNTPISLGGKLCHRR